MYICNCYDELHSNHKPKCVIDKHTQKKKEFNTTLRTAIKSQWKRSKEEETHKKNYNPPKKFHKTAISSYLLIITLNVNGLIQNQKAKSGWKDKQDQSTCCL